jgi:hypothetical protein
MMTHWMSEGGEVRIRITSSSSQSRYVPAANERTDSLENAIPARSPRYSSQAYFWSQDWQQGEKLADWDLFTGGDYEPTDIEDLIRWLDED